MSTMGRSHRSHYSHQNYHVTNERPQYYAERPYYSERNIFTTTERPMYAPERPMYASERNLYYGNGVHAPLPPPTEHSQIMFKKSKRPKFGPCTWILICIFTVFVAVIIILLIIFFTWGHSIQDKTEYDRTHQG